MHYYMALYIGFSTTTILQGVDREVQT